MLLVYLLCAFVKCCTVERGLEGWLTACLRGSRFYYADERKAPDGRPAVEDLDGEAHGEMYWELVQPGEQGKWLVTFSKGIGRAEYSAVNVDGTPYRPRY